MEKLYHLAKRFKAYQFDGDLKTPMGTTAPNGCSRRLNVTSCFSSVQSFTLTTSRTAA